MDEITRIEIQEGIERAYNRKHIDGYIKEEILANPAMVKKLNHGVKLLADWLEGDYYAQKNKRLEQVKQLDLEKVVMDVFIGVAYCQTEELFTSVTAKMAGRMKFDDKRDAIFTVAEIVSVLCLTDAFDIVKADRSASLMVVSNIPLSKQLVEFIKNSQYLPPMVCQPKELHSNYDSGYLTHKDSLVLGRGNHHDGELCLDVLNLLNKVELKLATDFISAYEEHPTFELDTQDKLDQWNAFKLQSMKFYKLLARCDNRFYLTHRVDKRGRIYSCGYHISTQGTAYKKAAIEFAKEEIVEGVPDACRGA